MLNELLEAERGAKQAGVQLDVRHPDIKDSRQIPTLQVLLDSAGHVASVRPLPEGSSPWTLRDGQHNSFPFVQPKHPLWLVSENDKRRAMVLDAKGKERREAILSLADELSLNTEKLVGWPGAGLVDRIRQRRDGLSSLEGTAGAGVLATMNRFLAACDPELGGDAMRLLNEIIAKLVSELREFSEQDWVEVAAGILVGGGAGFLFDADGDWPSILDAKVVSALSAAMNRADPAGNGGRIGHCGLTGENTVPLVESTFPQPNLPLLGQTYLFARNKDAPANDRYGRFSADSMPVSQDIVVRLAAAAEALTSEERKNVTWRSIPGEAPKQSDLFLAFVEKVPEAELAKLLANDEDDQSAEEPKSGADAAIGDIASFEKDTQRLIETIRAKVSNYSDAKVQLLILRKLDPANRKAVYSGQVTVGALRAAADDWIRGESIVRNLLTLPVLHKGERKPRSTRPPHVAPLGLPLFSRQMYVRGGTQKQEITGFPASEALSLFLDLAGTSSRLARARVERVLHFVLHRRWSLVSGVAHALRRSFDAAKEFDRREALRTVTMLGILLHKLGSKENYMDNVGFKFGQLLAAADVVHVGYCADMRGGDVPPSLLGNQVFSIAQSSPERALAMLSRRWKPYGGWTKRAARERERTEALVSSKKPDEQRRGWDIRKALRHAREIGPLAEALAPEVAKIAMNDKYRAELLLGYIAGLPKAQSDEENGNGKDTKIN